ncbi:MAG: glycosyltransferase family 2 protein [Bacteroidota bacterium]
MPLVSVGIPTYNGAARIETSLASLLNQDYPKLEIIISDNASTDNTTEVCEAYARGDHRIQYHRQSRNLGLMPNFEYLLHVASGKYFIFLSDDDSFAPGILSEYVSYLEAHPDHSMVSGTINYYHKDELFDSEAGISIQSEKPMQRSLNLYARAKMAGLIHGMFRREWGNKLRLKSILGNDWHFLAALAFKGKIHQLPKVGYHKSMNGSSSNFHSYVKSMGERKYWAYFPFFKIALDAFREISTEEPAYQVLPSYKRYLSASYAYSSVLFNYYVKIVPRKWVGSLMRALNIQTPREKKIAMERAKLVKNL